MLKAIIFDFDFTLANSSKGVYKLLEKLRLKKEECVYIGDSLVDAETANNSNILFIPI